MIEPLQEFDFRKSQYERPNRKWVCGWARDGEPCRIGPDSRGHCQGHRECLPYKDGDTYRCARPPTMGGQCEQGPNSDGSCPQQVVRCQPIRSWMARRKLVTFSATAAALGTCLLLFGGDNDSLTSPGPLTLQHHSESQTCADCHSAAEETFAQWVSSTLTPMTSRDDSERCLACHKQLGTRAMQPHNIAEEQLRVQSESGSGSKQTAEPWLFTLAGFAPALVHNNQAGLACSACHHEHRGTDFDLTQMTNHQCQACHSRRFKSFSAGHPEFGGYPYPRRTRIRFDHATHYGTHFATYRRVAPDADVPKDLTETTVDGVPLQQSCYACHDPDPSVKTMPIRGFDSSCAACHEPRMQADALPGIAFFALPYLDTNSELIANKTVQIGEWPAVEPSTQQVPPFMELLLRSDAQAASVLDRLAENGWSGLNSLEPEDIESLVWSVKKLVYEIVQNGQPAMERRLRQTLGDSIPDPDLTSLCGELPTGPDFVETLAKLQGRWFPNLAEEMQARNDGMQLDPVPVEVSGDSSDVDAGWYVPPTGAAVRYRVAGHADKLLRAWLDVTAGLQRIAHRVDPGAVTAGDAPRPGDGPGDDPILIAAARAFTTLSDRSRPFRCMDCHTSDRQENGRLRINWYGFRTSPGRQSFTRFSHAPHTMLLSEEGCTPCHRLDPELRFFRSEFLRMRENWTVNTDPHSDRTSGFLAVSKETCTRCHVQQLAGDSCLKCHNYHVFNSAAASFGPQTD